jgi:hypothetical protein
MKEPRGIKPESDSKNVTQQRYERFIPMQGIECQAECQTFDSGRGSEDKSQRKQQYLYFRPRIDFA